MAPPEPIVVCIVILPIAPLFRANREPRIDGAENRAADVALGISFVETAISQRAPGGNVVRGPVRNIVDGPTCGVLAKQGALRPFQHLDALQIEGYPFTHPCEREWNLVGINANSGRDCDRLVVSADSAQSIDRRTVGAFGKRESWHNLREIRGARYALVLELGTGNCCDGHWDVAQPLGALFRCDDDFLHGG